MVNIIEDFEILVEYAGEKLGFYQLIDVEGKIEVRVQTGKIGYIRMFEFGDDKLLGRILEFCKKHRYIQVFENLQDERFFK